MNLKNKKIGVIGFGNMAQAVLTGALSQKKVLAKNILLLRHRPVKDRQYQKKYQVKLIESIDELLEQSDVLFLAVKPQQLKNVFKTFPKKKNWPLIITVIAGIDSKFYDRHIDKNIRLIRCMPNTPSLIGLGANGYFANARCKKSDIKICEDLFSSVGLNIAVSKESLIDTVIAVSGSGPAFVYQYAQAVITQGQKMGLSLAQSKSLALQTLKGATALMDQSSLSPDQLTQKVTSKGGTTLAGLKVLKEKKFKSIIAACMKASAKRAKELSKILGR